MCDQVMVIYRGRIVETLAGDVLAELAIMNAAVGGHGTTAPSSAHWYTNVSDSSGVATQDHLAATGISAGQRHHFVFRSARGHCHSHRRQSAPRELFRSQYHFGERYHARFGWNWRDGRRSWRRPRPFARRCHFARQRRAGHPTRRGELGVGTYTMLAAAIAIGIGVVIGAINGVLVSYLRLPSIIVTLATMFVAQGGALLILKYPGGTVSNDFANLLVGDVIADVLPVPILIMVLAVLVWMYLKRIRFGVALYAIGSDAAAAQANRVDVRFIRFLSFTIAGAFFGWAGLFITANSGSGDPLIGAGFLLKVFTAVVLGGTLIGGGRGGSVGNGFRRADIDYRRRHFFSHGSAHLLRADRRGHYSPVCRHGSWYPVADPRLAGLRALLGGRTAISSLSWTASNAFVKAEIKRGGRGSAGSPATQSVCVTFCRLTAFCSWWSAQRQSSTAAISSSARTWSRYSRSAVSS